MNDDVRRSKVVDLLAWQKKKGGIDVMSLFKITSEVDLVWSHELFLFF